MWDFEHEPRRSDLRLRYQIGYTTPSACAAELIVGDADLGLVPVAALATTRSLVVVPGCTIAALDRVRSILLVVRAPDGVSGVRTVAADTSSRTSTAYARILFSVFWKVPAAFVPHEPDLEGMLAVADAALLIGDPALLALEDKMRARPGRASGCFTWTWPTSGTALPDYPGFPPFGPCGLTPSKRPGMCARELVEDLHSSRDHGLAMWMIWRKNGRNALPSRERLSVFI